MNRARGCVFAAGFVLLTSTVTGCAVGNEITILSLALGCDVKRSLDSQKDTQGSGAGNSAQVNVDAMRIADRLLNSDITCTGDNTDE